MTITDIAEVSYIKVLLNIKFLHFLIKYFKHKECQLIMFPVQHNGTFANGYFAEDKGVVDSKPEQL